MPVTPVPAHPSALLSLRPSLRASVLRTALAAGATAAVLAGFGTAAWASGDWSAAQHKAEDFKHHAEELTRQTPSETRKIVSAICEASDDGRKSAADSASSSARSTIADRYGSLEREKRDAVDALEAVERDDHLKDKHSDASSLESDIKSRWDKLSELTRSLRDGRHPVVEFMLSHGESARRDHMDRCDAKDVSLSYRHADCLIAQGDTCKVVELTSAASRAVSTGHDHARSNASSLNDELKKSGSDVIKHLIDRNHSFEKCKRFEPRVDCYKQCPEIHDDNRFSEPSADWRTDC
jgi:hypothetical protein